jgi:hypothetical protein
LLPNELGIHLARRGSRAALPGRRTPDDETLLGRGDSRHADRTPAMGTAKLLSRQARGASSENCPVGMRSLHGPGASGNENEVALVRSRASLTKAALYDTILLVVLDGELAVPCNPQSATAGLNSLSRICGQQDCWVSER